MSSESETNPFEPPRTEIEPARRLTDDPEFAVTVKPAKSPRPWGPWATIAWTILCIVVMFIVQIAVLIIFAVGQFARNESIEDLAKDGNCLAAATVATTPIIIGLVAFVVWVRHYPIRDYLALIWPDYRSIVVALVCLFVVLGASDLTTYLLGRPIVPNFMVSVYRTGWLPVLLLAIVVLAPLEEETLFRGFLYKGIAASRRAGHRNSCHHGRLRPLARPV